LLLKKHFLIVGGGGFFFQLLDSCHTDLFRRTHRRSVVGYQKAMELYSETGRDKVNDWDLILTTYLKFFFQWSHFTEAVFR